MTDDGIRTLGIIHNRHLVLLQQITNVLDSEQLERLRHAVQQSQVEVVRLHGMAIDNAPVARKLEQRTESLEKASYFLEWLQTHYGQELRRMMGPERSKEFTNALIHTARALK